MSQDVEELKGITANSELLQFQDEYTQEKSFSHF